MLSKLTGFPCRINPGFLFSTMDLAPSVSIRCGSGTQRFGGWFDSHTASLASMPAPGEGRTAAGCTDHPWQEAFQSGPGSSLSSASKLVFRIPNLFSRFMSKTAGFGHGAAPIHSGSFLSHLHSDDRRCLAERLHLGTVDRQVHPNAWSATGTQKLAFDSLFMSPGRANRTVPMLMTSPVATEDLQESQYASQIPPSRPLACRLALS